jgi:translation elongation factor EF-4
MSVLLNGKVIDVLSAIVHQSEAQLRGRALALKLKNVVERYTQAHSLSLTTFSFADREIMEKTPP